MDINYLLSVLNLYLEKEEDKLLTINVANLDSIVKIDFSYNASHNKTYVKLDKKIFLDNIKLFIDKIQVGFDISKEEYSNLNYNIVFSNSRLLNFKDFSSNELELIRNNIKTLNEFNFSKIETNELNYNEIYVENKKNNLSFQMGWTNFLTLFILAILFSDIFMIALLVFKSFK